MKKCSTCKLLKNLSSFSNDKSRKDGLSHRCKECQSKLGNLHYLRNKEKYKNSMQRYKDKKRQIVNSKKERPCSDCGIQYPTWIMDFDHIKGDKKFTIGEDKYSHKVCDLLEEISKCEVVCSNCHRHRTYMRLQG